jgi:hypothetical protein
MNLTSVATCLFYSSWSLRAHSASARIKAFGCAYANPRTAHTQDEQVLTRGRFDANRPQLTLDRIPGMAFIRGSGLIP